MRGPGLSRPEEVPQLKALWKQAFGDDDALIDAFFQTLYRPEQVFVCREAGRVAAMACWLPETVCWQRRGWPAAYLYAVATDEAARGRGHCGRLLAYAAGYLAARGVRALLLVPGSASLRQFYARHGYRDFSTVRRETLRAVPVTGSAETVPPPVYGALRERLLEDGAYVSCPVPVLAFQEAAARLYGGGLLRLEKDGLEGCACVARDGQGRAILYELLWPGDLAEGGSLAAGMVDGEELLVRTPGGSEPFAMARWLGGAPEGLPAPYLGIALD